jgi:formylglycine-generating enzyme required for sulfatase activity
VTEKLKSILEAEDLTALLVKFNEQGVIDSILGDLTDADLKDLGVAKLGERRRLLASFRTSCGGAVAVSVVEKPLAHASGSAPSITSASPAEATKDSPWFNSLGMPFVPIPRFEARFCIWPVRVQDYEAYCVSSSEKFPEIPFSQESDHPIVGVSWNDAVNFCAWLTSKERSEGKIDDKTEYRLPTDLEWSAAVGLPHESEVSPEERHLKLDGYPWGLRWPPPKEAGNYEHERNEDHCELKDQMLWHKKYADDWEEYMAETNDRQSINNALLRINESRPVENAYRNEYNKWLKWRVVDQYEFTSPVQSFSPNSLGIYDLGGNVWEWCMDDNLNNECVLRGASFCIPPLIYYGFGDDVPHSVKTFVENKDLYKSSFRLFENRGKVSSKSIYTGITEDSEIPDGGFRVVVASSLPSILTDPKLDPIVQQILNQVDELSEFYNKANSKDRSTMVRNIRESYEEECKIAGRTLGMDEFIVNIQNSIGWDFAFPDSPVDQSIEK